MGGFYGNKIKNKEFNSKTGKPWTLKDVPAYWRPKTAQWIEKEEE